MKPVSFASRLRALAGLGLALLAASSAAVAQTPQSPPPPLPAGTRAPAFTTKTLDGKPLSLRALRGKVVLLDFWATWCGPCRMSTPTLVSLQQKFGRRGFTVVGLSLDGADTRAAIKPFMRAYGVTYPVAAAFASNFKAGMAYQANYDPNNPSVRFDHPVLPATFLIDRKGIVRWSQVGYSPNEGGQLASLVQKLVAEKGARRRGEIRRRGRIAD